MDLSNQENKPNPWWLFRETVTVLHGTTEAHLERILEEGLKPIKQDTDGFIREVVGDYLPEEEISEDLLSSVKSKAVAEYKDNQMQRDERLFCILYPSTSAGGYASNYAEHGGELAHGIWQALQDITGKNFEPRFAGSRPIVIQMDVPWKAIKEGIVKNMAYTSFNLHQDKIKAGDMERTFKAMSETTRSMGA